MQLVCVCMCVGLALRSQGVLTKSEGLVWWLRWRCGEWRPHAESSWVRDVTNNGGTNCTDRPDGTRGHGLHRAAAVAAATAAGTRTSACRGPPDSCCCGSAGWTAGWSERRSSFCWRNGRNGKSGTNSSATVPRCGRTASGRRSGLWARAQTHTEGSWSHTCGQSGERKKGKVREEKKAPRWRIKVWWYCGRVGGHAHIDHTWPTADLNKQ